MEEDPMFFSCVTYKIIEKYFLPKKQKKNKVRNYSNLGASKKSKIVAIILNRNLFIENSVLFFKFLR